MLKYKKGCLREELYGGVSRIEKINGLDMQ